MTMIKKMTPNIKAEWVSIIEKSDTPQLPLNMTIKQSYMRRVIPFATAQHKLYYSCANFGVQYLTPSQFETIVRDYLNSY
jgi:hypothetical protein